LIIFLSRQSQRFGDGDPEFFITHDGQIRKYKVHTPLDYRGDKVPMVIYIHGGGGDMRAAYMDGIDKFSDKYGFIIAIPEGTGEVKLGHTRAQWNGGKWETGECCGDADDVGFISRMIDEIKSNFNIDEKRVYATGISNGGLMTNRIGCELSEKIAAIATVAPAAIISDCNPSRAVSVMDIHGTADPANPPDGSEPRSIFNEESGSGFAKSYKRMTPYQVVEKWKKINGCSDKYGQGYKKGGASCIIYNQCENGSEVELCIVEGMGHTYPSGSQYLPKRVVGPVSYDISFDQIWDFFKRHQMK
jgi:polyhydroxybutyrate depolymerase